MSRPTQRQAAFLLQAIVFAVVAVAGIAKFTDLPSFRASLESWKFIPRPLQAMVALAVPSVELTVAIAWMLGIARPLAVRATIAMLVLFTAAYAAHWAWSGPPDCKCFGRILDYSRSIQDARFVLARNTVLVLTLLVTNRMLVGTDAIGRGRPPAPEGARAGFTLVETLLVIVLIGILAALLVPSLSRVRDRAKVMKDLANLRSHSTSLSAYTTDYKEVFPYFTDPRATVTVIRNQNGVLQTYYFGASFTWSFALSYDLYNAPWTDDSFRSPFESRQAGKPGLFTAYAYSATTLADPAFWNTSSRTGPNQWRATRDSEVNFPAQKGLLVSLVPFPRSLAGGTSPMVRLALIDGHADDKLAESITDPYPSGEGAWVGSHIGAGVPVLHTIDGLRGRDVRK